MKQWEQIVILFQSEIGYYNIQKKWSNNQHQSIRTV